MQNFDLHRTAYNHFRNYLDLTYAAGAGREVLGLSTGYPPAGTFPLPTCILRHLTAFEEGREKHRAGYGWEAGSRPLREALVQYENLMHGTSYGLQNICMTAGATYAFNRVMECLFEGQTSRRDLFVVAPTFYRLLGRADRFARVFSVSGDEKNDYQITVDQVIDNLTPQTRAVFLLNPSNPTFLYYSDTFIRELIAELSRREITLIIDESGDAFCMRGPRESWTNMSFPSDVGAPNVVRIVTASKKYLLAEYRIGYVLANSEFIGDKSHGFVKLIGDDMGNPPLAGNDAWLEIVNQEIALRLGDATGSTLGTGSSDFGPVMRDNLNCVRSRRDYAVGFLREQKYIERVISPDSSFNLTFKLRHPKYNTDIEFFIGLLKETRTSVLPACGLGIDKEARWFRLTYGMPEDLLHRGLEMLKDFMN
jgi:aspartate/methionine/tyrosine aminotransferase